MSLPAICGSRHRTVKSQEQLNGLIFRITQLRVLRTPRMGPSGSGGAARAWLGGSWNRRAGCAAPITVSLPQRTVPRHSFLAHLEAWERKRHLWLSTPHLPTWKREVLHNDTLRDQGNTGQRVTATHRGRPPGEQPEPRRHSASASHPA